MRPPRADNRLPLLLDAAAKLFGTQGFHGTSIRDIVRAVKMLPGSVYYHFTNKDTLLAAVYAEGVRRISERVKAACAGKADPWERLEAACVAHLEALLAESDYARVVIRVQPTDVPSAARKLIAQRDGYERLFVELIAGLPLPRGADRRTLRLLLLGALNWTQTWYRPGRDTPAVIAQRYVHLLRTRNAGS
jgi:TetR/AcrR family transcriptional regulator, cholesterol catabolism regulator